MGEQAKARMHALARLEFLVGDWSAANRHFAGPFGPEGRSRGRAHYAWSARGSWLRYESAFEAPVLGPYEVHGMVGYDPRLGRYRAWAFNSLGVAIEYVGEWVDERRLVFDAVSPAPGRRARVAYERRPDGGVVFTAESAAGEGPFQPYFESMLVR